MNVTVPLSSLPETPRPAATAQVHNLVRLSEARRGMQGVLVRVGAEDDGHGAIEPEELVRRLLEMGFVEGAHIRVLHEGFIGRDPIAVQLDDMRIALRRREARGVWVDISDPAS